MGKHSKRDRRETMNHRVTMPFHSARIDLLKNPKTQYTYETVKWSFKKEFKMTLALIGCSALGMTIYHFATQAMQ